LAQANLELNSLDHFARRVAESAPASTRSPTLGELLNGRLLPVLELVANYADLGDSAEADARSVLSTHYLGVLPREQWHPLAGCWADALLLETPGGANPSNPPAPGAMQETVLTGPIFPHHAELLPALFASQDTGDSGGQAPLLMGHLLFHLGRHQEARQLWEQAATSPDLEVIACRALGMASLHLQRDTAAARQFLTRAHRRDPTDTIVARDLARVLFQLADQAAEEAAKRDLLIEARDSLRAAFAQGRGRSDVVALLARAHNRLGAPADTAQLLDTVRVTIWEGGREVHDLFEEAHLALGDGHLSAGRAAEALREFDRALEYPANLATGRLESTRDAHIHYRRGQAFKALGQLDEAKKAWKKAADEPASGDAKKDEARGLAAKALAE
jgi:tetratricopeptide (TPR) repeat protein